MQYNNCPYTSYFPLSVLSFVLDYGLGIKVALWAVKTGGAAQRRAVAHHITERRPMRRSYILDRDDHSGYATVAGRHFCCGGSTTGPQGCKIRRTDSDRRTI